MTSTLVFDLLAFIHQPTADDAAFDTLALRLFAHQLEHNLPYQRFCQQRGITRRTVKGWRDIPAVPINAFKDLDLSCTPAAECARVFMTSGTTRGDVKGRHYHPSLSVYDASMRTHFQQRFMPGASPMRMGILFPDEQAMPNSSLAHYLALAMQHFGTPESRCYMGPQGLDIASLQHDLAQARAKGEPMALLGASYSFVHLMDALQDKPGVLTLPAGSRLLDTGGFKGQSRELALDDFYQQLSATFGVARSQCINMYGMTELSTQFYDQGNATVPSRKHGAHWIRSRVVDPLTGHDMPPGARGVLAHCDLANFNSVTTILTEDVGIMADDGFWLLGRAQGAQAKGCSLAVDEFLKAART